MAKLPASAERVAMVVGAHVNSGRGHDHARGEGTWPRRRWLVPEGLRRARRRAVCGEGAGDVLLALAAGSRPGRCAEHSLASEPLVTKAPASWVATGVIGLVHYLGGVWVMCMAGAGARVV